MGRWTSLSLAGACLSVCLRRRDGDGDGDQRKEKEEEEEEEEEEEDEAAEEGRRFWLFTYLAPLCLSMYIHT